MQNIEILSKPCGDYQTNCYIIRFKDNISKEIIIDPGIDAFSWISTQVDNPIAILNTHGHFDHIWSNAELKKAYNIPIYCPKDDVFMLQNDPFHQGTPQSKADIQVDKVNYNIGGLEVEFHHFAGHTPGCSVIVIRSNNQNIMFSGDFIFANSIGRTDFPYSNPQDMKNSINKILQYKDDYIIYPGHGNSTTLNQERKSLSYYSTN